MSLELSGQDDYENVARTAVESISALVTALTKIHINIPESGLKSYSSEDNPQPVQLAGYCVFHCSRLEDGCSGRSAHGNLKALGCHYRPSIPYGRRFRIPVILTVGLPLFKP